MCENPLCGPYLAWQAVSSSRGMGKRSAFFRQEIGDKINQISSLLLFGDPLLSKNGRSKSGVGGGAVASDDAGWIWLDVS